MIESLPGGLTIKRAIEEMTINEKDDKISFGPLGELSITELTRCRKYSPLYPWGRRFSTLILLLMRSKALSIMRMALELSRREDAPAEVRKIAFTIKAEALSLLRNIDERLFNIKYALYDEL